jgi:nucleoside-diphosphate-sugar epimerase
VRVPGALMLRVATGLEVAHRLGAPVPTITRRSIRNLTEGAHFSIERARRELGYVPRLRREDLSDLLPELQRYHDSLQKSARAQ